MNTPYVTTKELAELLPFSLRHLSERVTHRRDFPAYSTTSINRWGEEGGNALWLGGVILILLSAVATPLLV